MWTWRLEKTRRGSASPPCRQPVRPTSMRQHAAALNSSNAPPMKALPLCNAAKCCVCCGPTAALLPCRLACKTAAAALGLLLLLLSSVLLVHASRQRQLQALEARMHDACAALGCLDATRLPTLSLIHCSTERELFFVTTHLLTFIVVAFWQPLAAVEAAATSPSSIQGSCTTQHTSTSWQLVCQPLAMREEGPSRVHQTRRFLLLSAAASSNCHPVLKGITAVGSYHAAP
jgi:hypothetical protein